MNVIKGSKIKLKEIPYLLIENQFGNQGLQYTFNNQYSPSSMTLSNNDALFIIFSKKNGEMAILRQIGCRIINENINIFFN